MVPATGRQDASPKLPQARLYSPMQQGRGTRTLRKAPSSSQKVVLNAEAVNQLTCRAVLQLRNRGT